MPTLNEYKKAALKTLTGVNGDINRLEYIWLRSVVSPYVGSIPDMWREFLRRLGFTSGNLPDRWMKYLGSLGYTGSLNNRWFQFWKENSYTNLVLISSFPNDISDSYWTKKEGTITAGVPDPYGGDTAKRFLETVTNDTHEISKNGVLDLTIDVKYIMEAIVKPIGGRQIQFQLWSNSYADSYAINFNLSTGTVGSVTMTSGNGVVSNPVASVVAAGNGFYRCRLSFTSIASFTDANLFWTVQPTEGSTGGYVGDITKGLDFYSLGLYRS